MFMWTVGYTVGDIMYVAQTTADQRSASWFSKVLECLAVTLENETAWLTPLPQVLWLLALLCVLTYAGYQIYLSYLSYTNPDWYKFLAMQLPPHRRRPVRTCGAQGSRC